MQKLIGSSYLLGELCEAIYFTRRDSRDFTLLEVQAFWSNAISCFGNLMRAEAMAILATSTLDPVDQAFVEEQLDTVRWKAFLARKDTEEWPFPMGPPPVAEMSAEALLLEKSKAKAKIDRDAENARLKYVTGGSAQSMVYAQKEKEASLYAADADVDRSLIPHLVAESELNGIDLEEQALIYRDMADAWLNISPAIEIKRLSAKNAVDEAKSYSAVLTATNIDWNVT